MAIDTSTEFPNKKLQLSNYDRERVARQSLLFNRSREITIRDQVKK